MKEETRDRVEKACLLSTSKKFARLNTTPVSRKMKRTKGKKRRTSWRGKGKQAKNRKETPSDPVGRIVPYARAFPSMLSSLPFQGFFG